MSVEDKSVKRSLECFLYISFMAQFGIRFFKVTLFFFLCFLTLLLLALTQQCMVQSSFSLRKCYVTLCASFCLWRKRSSTMQCTWMEVDNIWAKVERYSLCGIGGGKKVCLQQVGASLVPSQKMWLLSFHSTHCYKSLSDYFKTCSFSLLIILERSLSTVRIKHCSV